MVKQSFEKGFTLIELLVVIVIIGILATLATVGLNSVRAKARDAKRISDIRQVQSALELYLNENNSYPTTGQVQPGMPLTSPDGSKTYMSKVPGNPKPWAEGSCSSTGAEYSYISNYNNTYQISYCLANSVNEINSGACTAIPGSICNRCIKNCVGKNCGSDGCGGSCGTCTGANVCTNGNCTCVSDCASAGRCAGATDNCGNACASSVVATAPTSVTITPSAKQNVISWSAVANATGYKVYGNTSGSNSLLYSGTSLTYTQTGLTAQSYYYTVVATVCGNDSPKSTEVTACFPYSCGGATGRAPGYSDGCGGTCNSSCTNCSLSGWCGSMNMQASSVLGYRGSNPYCSGNTFYYYAYCGNQTLSCNNCTYSSADDYHLSSSWLWGCDNGYHDTYYFYPKCYSCVISPY